MQNAKCIVALSICVALSLSVRGETATAAASQATSSAGQEMIDLQNAYIDAQGRGDAGFIENALADDFTSIETNGDSSGKKDVLREVHPAKRLGPRPILYDFKVVELDAACFVVTYDAVFPDAQSDRYQHLSNTWVRQDGKWKLKFQQSTLNLWSAHDLD